MFQKSSGMKHLVSESVTEQSQVFSQDWVQGYGYWARWQTHPPPSV